MYYGDYRLGETFDIKFTTIQSTGAPITLAGTPAVSAYPGNSTTEITAGITLSVDLDSRTGMHNVRVVATSGNGYATATNYALVLTAGTVDSVSVVGYVIGHFSVENRSALMPTTAARTLDVSAGGEAGLDWANIGSPTTAVNLSATNIDVDQVVASVSGAVASVTGNVGGNVTGSVGSLAAQAKADVNAEVDAAIETYHLDHLLAATYDPASKPGAADALLNELVESDGGVARYTANALEQAPTGGSAPTAAEIADAVWDEAQADHVGAGSFGEVATEVAAILVDTGTTLDGKIDTIDSNVDAVLLDTAEIGAAGAGLTNINLPDQTMNITGNITGNLSGSVGSVTGAVGSVTGNVGGNVAGSVGSVTAEVNANVQKINDVTLQGDGSGTPWGPV